MRIPFQGSVAIQTVPSYSRLAADPLEEIRDEIGGDLSFVAASPVMRKIRAEAEVLAKLDAPVLILGESGSGKEVIGRLIHALSTRSVNRFLKVSCAALPPDFLECELFGREKGALSKTRLREIGPFALCHKGTLFLDDIDEMPSRTQAQLLCFLQDKEFSSGRLNPVEVDVRILAATKMKIETALSKGKVRNDLYYSLSAFTIPVPPLRQRKDEIPLLLKHFMNRVAKNYALPVRDFSPAMVLACQNYDWPGNLRELEKFVKRYLVSGDDETFCSKAHNLPKTFPAEGMIEADFKLWDSVPDTSAPQSLLHSVKGEAERNAIDAALGKTRWNRKAAARLLQISYRSLLYKIERYHMSPHREGTRFVDNSNHS